MESELNREYCEAQRILKAFGKLAAEVQSRAPATVARASQRDGLSHTLSHRFSHMTYGSPAPV
jgi:hypothetical protein